MTTAAPREALRRSIHFATASLGLAPILGFPHRATTMLLLSLTIVALVLELLRRFSAPVEQGLEFLSAGALRPAETTAVTGGTLLAIGYCVAWLLFPAIAAAPAIVVTAVADPAAALVGSRVTRHWGRKSVAGSAAAFAAALVVLLVLRRGMLTALLGSAVAALAERMPGRGLDNLAMPLATSAVLAWRA